MSPMQHSTALRLADTPDRITVLAAAMRVLLADPGSAEASRDVDTAVADCTREEYEMAWQLAQPKPKTAAGHQYQGPPRGARMLTVIPAAPAAAPAAITSPRRGHLLRDMLAVFASALRAVSGDTVITWAMAATVAVVAVDAAIVSYSHIYALATGVPGSGVETGIQPHLLPLSIDGVIAEASLVLLFAARHKLDAPKLARFMLAFGIAATVAANVVHGLPSSLLPPVAHVVISAFLSAWPAGAFIGSVEMAMQLVRATRDVADTEADNSADTEADSRPDNPADSVTDRSPDRPADTAADTSGTPAASRPAKTAAPADPVAVMIRRRPKWDDEKIASECRVHPRTVKRRRQALADAAPSPARPPRTPLGHSAARLALAAQPDPDDGPPAHHGGHEPDQRHVGPRGDAAVEAGQGEEQ